MPDWCSYIALARRLVALAGELDPIPQRPIVSVLNPVSAATPPPAPPPPSAEDVALARAGRRTAVSRAYYGAYNQAVAIVRVRDPGHLKPKEPEHWKTWDWFKKFPGNGYQIWDIGRVLRESRNSADYDGRHLVTQSNALEAVEKAERLARVLEVWDRKTPRP